MWLGGGRGGGRIGGWAVAANLANINDSLGSLNSNLNYDLKNVLENYFGEDNDENSFTKDNHSYSYYDFDSLFSKFNNNNIIFSRDHITRILPFFLHKTTLSESLDRFSGFDTKVWKFQQPSIHPILFCNVKLYFYCLLY